VAYVLISPEVRCMLPFIAPKLVKSANKFPTAKTLIASPFFSTGTPTMISHIRDETETENTIYEDE